MSSAAGTLLLGAKDSASDILKAAFSTMRDGLNTVAAVATKATKGLSAMATVLGPIVSVAQMLFGIVSSLFSVVSSLFAIVSNALKIIQSLFSILLGIFRAVIAVAKTVVSVITSVVNAIGSLFSKVTGALGSLVGGSNSAFGKIVKYALAATAVVGGAFVAMAINAEHAWQPLAQTIGRIAIAGAGGAIKGIREFATEIRRATLTASADVVSLAEQAVRLRIPESQLKAVTAAAIGLSAALGISAESAMSKLGDALRHDFDALKSLIPQLKGATTDVERLAIVMRVAQQGIDLQGQSVSTFSGLWTAFKNVLSENAQVLGEKIAPGIKLIVDALRPLLGLLESSGNAFAAVFNTIAKNLAPIITQMVSWFATMYAGFLAFGQTVFQNWRQTWEFISTAFQYYATSISADVQHFFQNTLPAWFETFLSFTSNWAGALSAGLQTAFENLWQNVSAVSGVGWEHFKTGFKSFLGDLGSMAVDALLRIGKEFASFALSPVAYSSAAATQAAVDYFKGTQASAEESAKNWSAEYRAAWSRSMTEGFKGVALPNMPDVAGRQISAAEADLKSRMQGLGKGLGDAFNANFDKQLEGFRAILGGKLPGDIKNQIGGLSLLDKDSKSKGNNGGGGNSLFESRFLTRAPGSNPLDVIATEAKAHTKLLQDANTKLTTGPKVARKDYNVSALQQVLNLLGGATVK